MSWVGLLHQLKASEIEDLMSLLANETWVPSSPTQEAYHIHLSQ